MALGPPLTIMERRAKLEDSVLKPHPPMTRRELQGRGPLRTRAGKAGCRRGTPGGLWVGPPHAEISRAEAGTEAE